MLKDYLDYLKKFLKETVEKSGASGVVIGISGGIDSAVVSYLIKDVFPKNHKAIFMPIESSKLDFECIEQLLEESNLNNMTIDLLNSYKTLLNDIEKVEGNISNLSKANLKARLRMSTLYSVAQNNNYLVIGTDNMVEWHLGYFTKFGDGGVDVVPLVHLTKTEVWEAGRILGVPKIIIDREPTAGLWENQTDESEIGFPYKDIDNYLIKNETNNKKLKQIVDYLHKKSSHKRNLAISPIKIKR